jgi:hypothetical protein
MKISFVEKVINDKTASYRIWVKDLSKTLIELGHTVEIVQDISDIDSKVVIFGKSSRDLLLAYNKPIDTKVAAINFPCNFYDKKVDFMIAGSHEERVSMSNYEHVFVHPLIERKFLHIQKKCHNSLSKLPLTGDLDKIVLCYHGNYPHLFKFAPHLKLAIEDLSQLINVELNIITGPTGFKWESETGKPDNIKINYYEYDDSTFSKILLSSDIGLVPNVSDLKYVFNGIENNTSVDCGLYDTDYFLRFKNKTNSGRAYVFYQHGIPVIHDLSPSNFEFMARSGHFICAHDRNSWLRELKKLLCHAYRQEVSDDNGKAFEHYYNPSIFAKSLVEFIKLI